MAGKVKEKPSITRKVSEKAKASPKELLRRGLLTGAEKLQGQLRDASQGGRQEDTEADHAQNTARTAARQTAYRLEKLVHGKKKIRTGKLDAHTDVDDTAPDLSAQNLQSGQGDLPDSAEPVRVKTKDAARRFSPADHRHTDPVRFESPQIKTKDACIQYQATVPEYDPAIKSTVPPERQMPRSPQRGRQSSIRERPQKISVRETQNNSVPGHMNSVTEQKYLSSQPLEQGRQKFVRQRQEKVAAQRRANSLETDHVTPTQQRNVGNIQPQHTSTLSAHDGKRSAGNAVRETVSSSKRQVKEATAGTKAVGRASRQTVKAADSSKQVAQAGGHSTRTVQQAARAAVQARQRAVQVAGAARRAAATVDRPVVKAATSALRGAVSAIRTMIAPLAAGGGAVIAVVLVLCLVGALLMSPLGIFFSGEDNGGQTMSSVVWEINQEYEARVEALKASTTYDALSLSGSRATWPEVLTVYAVKTTSDPTNGLEVVTMNDTKKELLKQVFWDMNELSSFTSTVPGENDDEEDTTTLHITVTAKTADEMADVYGFNTDQRQQLAELLSDEYRELWSAVLYGIGTGSGEIVAVALSQVGNVGGQPYWSWYGFGSRVNWCAIFVSWCANECGYIDAGVVPKFAGCVQGSCWFKERGLWQDRSYTPGPGDVIFFDWNDPSGFSGPQDGVPDHVGIVERVENGRVYTVEGNSGDKCCQRSYPVGYYEIYGYGQLCP